MSLFSKLAGTAKSPQRPKPSDLVPGPPVKAKQDIVHDGDGQVLEALVLRRVRTMEGIVRTHEPRWRELWAHFDGDQYAYVSASDGQLTTLETREGGTKPAHRPRLARNRMTRAIVNECSILTSRFPSYDAVPINHDPDTVNTANVGTKVLINQHRELKLRRKFFQVVQNAAVTGDGYAWPYWDGSVGAPIMHEPSAEERMAGAADQVDTGLREGAVEVRALRQEQVGWEPGVEFERSRWYVIRLTEATAEIPKIPGYVGPETVTADALPFQLNAKDAQGQRSLAFVYHYLERPSMEHPKGRWIQSVGGKIIVPPADYPCSADIPVVHRMPWIERGDRRDRSLGLGELVIDIQRAINRICNQLIAWRNLILVPQVLAPRGTLVKPELSEEPGLVVEFDGPTPPQWRQVPDIPPGLYKELENAYADMDFIVGQGPAVLPNIASGSGIQAANEREQSYRSMLLGNLADLYASVGRHILYLVAEHWTEERILQVTGKFGVESIPAFKGTVLQGQIAGVTVSEASIEPRTRESQEAKIVMFADKQWISPEKAMQALHSGSADEIIDSFELDIGRVHRQISQLKLLGQNPTLQGLPVPPEALIPMAKPRIDNHQVFISVITDWMKTVDFERQPELVQVAAENWLEQHEQAIQKAQLQEAQMAGIMAQSQGMGNAAAPQTPAGAPSQPSMATSVAALNGQPAPN